MKLNEINFDLLSDKELISLCLKYKIVEKEKLQHLTRGNLLEIIKIFLKKKLEVYGQKKETKSISINRRMSTSGNMQKNIINLDKSTRTVPRPIIKRRMSHPITTIEKVEAKETVQRNEITRETTQAVKKEVQSLNPKYDLIGMYPPVKRLIAIGDLHGDLRVTIIALKLAELISQNSTSENINDIHWTGGSTWVIQMGDQIDRCRPDDLEKNCIKDFSDVFEDEGNNMAIIKLLLRLDDEAKKEGGRFLGLLGNHELMNIDKDFRYVSPQEFLEFVPKEARTSKYTDDGYPLGYYHRTKAFCRGGNIANMYAIKKKSIIVVGDFIFVHGGLTKNLMKKYTIPEINTIVSKWMSKTSNETEDNIFDEIFRDDDDMSPFWCRTYGEDDDDDNTEDSFNELLQTINQRNKLLMKVKKMVIAHTPQFMDNKYLNSIYNDRLWRVDVGMSRAFGEHNTCSEDKYRQIQILIIHDNERFEVRKQPFNSERRPSEGIGSIINIENEKMY